MIFALVIIISAVGIGFYFFNENKVRTLTTDFLNTENLSEEINDITIINDSTIAISNFDQNNPDFLTLTNLIEDIEIKSTDSEFRYQEGYSFIINNNNNSYHFSINENGLLQIDHKTYKIQDDKVTTQLFEFLRKSAQ